MPRFGQQLVRLMLVCLALSTAQGFLVKLPKMENWLEKLETKKENELLKKLDFLNLFGAKAEAKLEKKEDEWEKFTQWFESNKQKQLSFFEDKPKLKKKSKKPKYTTTTAKSVCCYEEYKTTPASYSAEESEEEEEEEEVVVAYKQKEKKPCPKSSKSYGYDHDKSYAPSAYDVRDDSAEGTRYFT